MTRRAPAALLAASLAAAFAAALAAPGAAAQDAGPTCADCHEDETAQWKVSSHARAMKPEFLAEWEKQGKKWECLPCHTTKYDRAAGTYSTEGVNCESCHGPANPDHPDKAKMSIKASDETCRSCHTLTYGEWRVSAHGQKDVGCMACHSMHAMELRKDDPDQQCGGCHTERLEDFAHATHKQKGLHCITCHMPDPPGVRNKIRGTGVKGHTYGVGVETCSGCHRVQVHQSGGMADLEHQVEALTAAGSKEHVEEIPVLRERVTTLEKELEGNRRVFPWVAVIGFALGSFVGFAVFRMRSGKGAAASKAE